MLHQPPRYRHGDDVGYHYLDEERTVQQPDDAEGRCSMHLADSYLADALADGIPGDAEQSEASEQQGDERLGVQNVGELHHFLVALQEHLMHVQVDEVLTFEHFFPYPFHFLDSRFPFFGLQSDLKVFA